MNVEMPGSHDDPADDERSGGDGRDAETQRTKEASGEGDSRRNGNTEADLRALRTVVATQQKLIDKLDDGDHPGKDIWDRLSVISTVVSSVILAAIGLYLSHVYKNAESERLKQEQAWQHQQNDRAIQVQEAESVASMMLYITSDDPRTERLAVLMINRTVGFDAAVQAALARSTEAAARGLRDLSRASDLSDEQREEAEAAAAEIYKSLPHLKIFYSTDRKLSESKEPTGDRGQGLSYGTAFISVPEDLTKPGRLSEPPWFQLGPEKDIRRYVTIHDLTSLERRAFLNEVRLILDATIQRELLIYVPGFNTTFMGAAKRLGQTAYDFGLRTPAILYSWPSGGSIQKYTQDEASIRESQAHFKEMLDALGQSTNPRSTNLVAYDLGCRLVAETIVEAASSADERFYFNNIVLVTPDLDVDSFKQMAPKLANASRCVTVYVWPDSPVLKASRMIHGGARLGAEITLMEGIDTVVIPNEPGAEVADDIGLLLLGIPPNRRNLEEKTIDSKAYWELGLKE